MSRILIFDKENRIAGEVHGTVNRGWAISESGQTTITLTNAEAGLQCIQLGRMVYVDGGKYDDGTKKLPNWAGMIDTPWTAIPPISMTVYDMPYLMKIRQPWGIDEQSGDSGTVAKRFLELTNQLGDLYLRPGNIDLDGITRKVPVSNLKPNWDQLVQVASDYGMEIQMRPELDGENRLIIYADFLKSVGEAVQLVLQDGESANMKIEEATLDGMIYNAVKGYNQSSTEAGRLYTHIETDQASIDVYGQRNTLQQFKATTQTDLEDGARNYLEANAKPILKLNILVNDDAKKSFSLMRLGNSVTIRATGLILPGGVTGWSGSARIKAMTYNESSNQIAMSVEGEL